MTENMNRKYTKTASFLTPALELKPPMTIYGPYYEDTFIGDSLKEEYATWGSHILILFNHNLPEPLAEYLRTHPSYVEEYAPSKGMRMFVFSLSNEIKTKVVEPFLQGKYSQVDRSYVEKFFPNQPTHNNYASRLVFDKSNLTRDYWEEKLGVALPNDAEVWSKPTKKEEIYGYIEPLPAQLEEYAPVDHGGMNPEVVADEELRQALED